MNYDKAMLELAKAREDTGGDAIEYHLKLGRAIGNAERAKRKPSYWWVYVLVVVAYLYLTA
jgi:hypothetical protein